LKMLRDGRENAAAIMALQDRADILIYGKVTVKDPVFIETYGANTYSCDVYIDLKSVSTDTAHVISSRRVKAIGAALNESSVREDGIEKAAQAWVRENTGKLVRAVVDPCKEYVLEFSDCSNNDVISLDGKLAESRFVRKTDLMAFDKGFAQLSVQFQGSIKMLSKELAGIKGVEVDGVTANKIRIHVLSKSR